MRSDRNSSLYRPLSVNIRSRQRWSPALWRNRNFSIEFCSERNFQSIGWCNTTQSKWNTIPVHGFQRRSRRSLSSMRSSIDTTTVVASKSISLRLHRPIWRFWVILDLSGNRSRCEWILWADFRTNTRSWSLWPILSISFAAIRDIDWCRNDVNIVSENPFRQFWNLTFGDSTQDNIHCGNLDRKNHATIFIHISPERLMHHHCRLPRSCRYTNFELSMRCGSMRLLRLAEV